MAERSRATAVVVTYDALPWIEQCLDSLRGVETVVVDNGSSDGTVAFVRERFPEVKVFEAENRGLGAGWNIGVRETSSTYVLLLNADAWLLDGALERLCDFADTRPRTAVSGRAFSTRTGRCSARFAVTPPSGGSRPSTSSCASSLPARLR